jgi:metallo-beta-lactamase family protein
MQISFHGAAQTVTGSKHLITLDSGKQILLDCGLFQGMGKETLELNSNFGFTPKDVHYVILSHAHIDHSGLLPKLVRDGFAGKIFCTPATADLIEVMLEDSAHIQASDIKFVNKRRAAKGQAPLVPIYGIEDVQATLALLVEVPYNTLKVVDAELSFEYKDAGHILGSASVHLSLTEAGATRRVTFSGDVGRYNDAILQSPQKFSQADTVIIESTYGNSLHEDFVGTKEALLQHITHTCVDKKGKLVIPAFSIGRTQELLYALNDLELEGKLPKVAYYVDSPLSVKVTEITKKHLELFNADVAEVMRSDADPFEFEGLKFVGTKEESKALNGIEGPCVIISASGMAEAGRIKHHIMNNIHNERNTILLVGYCSPHSLGGRLKAGEKEVKIFTDMYQVVAEVASMRSMSAHGDYDDLLQFLSCQDAAQLKHIFLVHGEHVVQQDFKKILENKGYSNIHIPQMHEKCTV